MSKEKTQAQSTICSNCGGQLEVNGLQETVECPFCGTSYSVADLLDESDAVRIEKIKSQTYKEVEADKIKREIEKEKSQEEKDSVAAFKKSKFSKVLIGFAIFGLLCIMTGFRDGRIMAGLTAVVMTALFIGSWLMGMKIIKEPKKGVRILSAIIAFVLIIPYFSFYNASPDRTEKFAWSDMELYEVLPEPSSNVGEIVSNSETSLSIYVHKVSKAQYKEYLKECEDMGYTIDAEKSEMNYSAYNQDGYKLSLWYNESDEELHIGLDAPLEMSEIQWPNSAIAKLLPVPKSNIGNISWENSGGFVIKVGNTTIEDFKAYADACSNNGFNVDYQKGDNYYYADDSNGNHISLNYEGNNIMTVHATAADGESEDDTSSVDAFVLVAGEAGEYGELFTVNKGNEFEETYYVYRVPSGTYKVTNVGDYMSQVNVYSDELKKTEEGWDEYAETFAVELLDVNKSATITIGEGQHIHIDEPSEFKFEMQSSGEKKEEAKKDTSTDGISSDFKAAMDSYEKFFDEYVAIMKKYANNPNDMSILADYTKYMGKYAQMMEDFEKWEDEDMNAAETAYYVQVQGRITKKLLEVGQ